MTALGVVDEAEVLPATDQGESTVNHCFWRMKDEWAQTACGLKFNHPCTGTWHRSLTTCEPCLEVLTVNGL